MKDKDKYNNSYCESRKSFHLVFIQWTNSQYNITNVPVQWPTLIVFTYTFLYQDLNGYIQNTLVHGSAWADHIRTSYLAPSPHSYGGFAECMRGACVHAQHTRTFHTEAHLLVQWCALEVLSVELNKPHYLFLKRMICDNGLIGSLHSTTRYGLWTTPLTENTAILYQSTEDKRLDLSISTEDMQAVRQWCTWRNFMIRNTHMFMPYYSPLS